MPKERNKADGYREKAADKGDMQSQVNVANAYYLGNGTEMDWSFYLHGLFTNSQKKNKEQ